MVHDNLRRLCLSSGVVSSLFWWNRIRRLDWWRDTKKMANWSTRSLSTILPFTCCSRLGLDLVHSLSMSVGRRHYRESESWEDKQTASSLLLLPQCFCSHCFRQIPTSSLSLALILQQSQPQGVLWVLPEPILTACSSACDESPSLCTLCLAPRDPVRCSQGLVTSAISPTHQIPLRKHHTVGFLVSWLDPDWCTWT